MKKCLILCGLMISANFFAPAIAFSFNSYSNKQAFSIPPPVLRTAELWACDNGVLPETPLPDYVRAFYTKMSKKTWEVNWVWSKGGIQGEVRLLITNGGTLLDEY